MNMILFFSHELTSEQKEDAIVNLKVNNFIKLPFTLQEKWSNVPAELEDLEEYSLPFKDFLRRYNKGDYVLIQGDFGLTCKMVNFAKSLGLIPIYATTKRESVEEKKGDEVIKISKFRHIMFRKY